MNLNIHTYSTNNCLQNSCKTNRKLITSCGVSKTIKSPATFKIAPNRIIASVLVFCSSILGFLTHSKDLKEESTQNMIDTDVKNIINNQNTVTILKKRMRKESKNKDISRNQRLNEDRKIIASLSRENKKIISKNFNLILKNDKYNGLPKGYHHRIKQGLYSLLNVSPSMFALNEDIIDWKIEVLKAEDSISSII